MHNTLEVTVGFKEIAKKFQDRREREQFCVVKSELLSERVVLKVKFNRGSIDKRVNGDVGESGRIQDANVKEDIGEKGRRP